MTKSRDIRNHLVELVKTTNAPVPLECRMLADGTIVHKDTGERMYPVELNRRYLIMLLASIEIPKPPEMKVSE